MKKCTNNTSTGLYLTIKNSLSLSHFSPVGFVFFLVVFYFFLSSIYYFPGRIFL